MYVHIILGTTNYQYSFKLLQSPFRVLPPSVSKQPGGYGGVRWTAHTFSHPQNMLVQWIGISSALTSRAPFCENEFFGEANVSIESLHAHKTLQLAVGLR